MRDLIRLLLVEDSPEDAELVEAVLVEAGLPCLTARVCTLEALTRALAEFLPDLVLSDFSLPGFDGRSALRRVLQRSPETPVIMVTGAIGDELAVELLQAGARDFVLKDRLARLPLAVERALSEATERRERRAAEQALRESEERNREIFQNSPDAIDVIEVTPERHFKVEAANGAWEWMTGKKSAEVRGRPLEAVVPAEEAGAWLARCRRCVEEGATITFEDRRFIGGQRRYFQTALTPLRGTSGEVQRLLAIARDITERATIALENAQLLEKEKEARATAEAAARIKSEFLDIAAHELKTPVAATLLLIQACQRQRERGVSVSDSALDRLRGQAGRLAALVEELLNVSRLERGTVALRPARVDLVALLSDVLDHAKARAPRRTFSLEYPRRPLEIELDPMRIQEVATNLLDNALNYTPEGSAVQVRVEELSSRIRVSVTDHGFGIPPDQQAGLFSRFFRSSSEATLTHPGLGLGLYICRSLVELHGGSMGLKSAVGEGSTFFFELPSKSLEAPAQAQA